MANQKGRAPWGGVDQYVYRVGITMHATSAFRRLTHRKLALAGAICAAQLAPGAVLAQNGPAPAAGIEELIVSVRFRDESLQEVPAAVTAFNEAALQNMAVMDLRDLSPATPNVNIQQVNQFPNAAAVHIRGIGDQRIESTEEPRAGISVDGIFFTRPVASNIDFFDVASVQILRGPTGVTFGKNSLAGGLQVETIRPSGELGGKVGVTMGNYGRQNYRFALDSPQVGDWAFRLSYLDQNYDGHFRNRFDGTVRGAFGAPTGQTLPIDRKLGSEDVRAGRAQALWTPSEAIDLRLIYGWVRDSSDATAGDQSSDDGSDPNWPRQIACLTQQGCPEPDDGPYVVGRDYYSKYDNDQDSFTAILNWDIGSTVLTAIGGAVYTDDYFLNDFDQSEFNFFPTSREQEHDQESIEIRLASDFTDSPIEWVVGAFYMQQEHELTQNFPTLGPSADYTTQESDSYGLFGQVIYAVTDQLNVTVGLRYSDEQKDFFRDPGIVDSTITLDPSTHYSLARAEAAARATTSDGDIIADLDTDHIDYKLAVDYQLQDNVMLYAQYATGFKAGEFGARANSPLTALPTDDEEAQSVELGMKSDWWDNRLQANLAVFWGQYDHLQFGVFVPSTNVTGQETVNLNVGEATTQGVELDLIAQLHDQFRLNFNAGYLDAKYDKFCADLNGPGTYPGVPTSGCGAVTAVPGGRYLVDEDHTDLELSRAPEWKYHLGGEFTQPLPNDSGELTMILSYTYTDKYFSDSTLNHPSALTGDFGYWDGSIAWTSPDENLRVAVWGKNLSDEEKVSGVTPTANFFNQRFWFAPLTWGVDVTYNFGGAR